MKEHLERPDQMQEYGRTSDIDPSAVGWVILFAGVAVWAWRKMKATRNQSEFDFAAFVLVLIVVVVLINMLGNLL